MKTIKPTKGLGKKLVVYGMYDNYFVYLSATTFVFVMIEIYLFGSLASDAEDSLRFSTFLIITVILAILLATGYFYFTYITSKGETKNYPKGNIRISNKNF